MSELVNEQYGKLPEKTVEERIEEGKALATKLAADVKGFAYRLKATSKGEKTYVTIWVNGKAANPGKISVGVMGRPTFFPADDADLETVETFLNAVDAAGIKLKIFQAEA